MGRIWSTLSAAVAGAIAASLVVVLVGGAGGAAPAEAARGDQTARERFTALSLRPSAVNTRAIEAMKRANASRTTGAANAEAIAGLATTSADAYARINRGSVDPGQSRNVARRNIFSAGPGAYCITGLSFTPRNAVAVLAANGFGGYTISARVQPNACAGIGPAGTGIVVVIENAAGARPNTDFNIWIVD